MTMILPRQAATDALALERALLDEPSISAGRVATITGLHLGRVAKAIAYLAGAGRLTWEGHNPTLYRVADGLEPTFDHVYATLEDVSEELAEVWPLVPPTLRHKIECCQVWLMRAMRIIDGEELPDRGHPDQGPRGDGVGIEAVEVRDLDPPRGVAVGLAGDVPQAREAVCEARLDDLSALEQGE